MHNNNYNAQQCNVNMLQAQYLDFTAS